MSSPSAPKKVESIYSYRDYRRFVRDTLESMPGSGRGQYLRMAEHLRVHNSLMSQIFRGKKNLTPEQALAVCEFLGLDFQESEYFLALVELERAGTVLLKSQIEKRLNKMRALSAEVKNRIVPAKELSEQDQAFFYSDWEFSAIRLLSGIREYGTVDAISGRLGLRKKRVREALDFLVNRGLCSLKDGVYTLGPSRTHVPAESPWARRHHINWRHQAINSIQRSAETELHFTAPLTLSAVDIPKLRETLLKTIQTLSETVAKSGSEDLYCFCLDWFQVGKPVRRNY